MGEYWSESRQAWIPLEEMADRHLINAARAAARATLAAEEEAPGATLLELIEEIVRRWTNRVGPAAEATQ